jgi:hypothetical protein
LACPLRHRRRRSERARRWTMAFAHIFRLPADLAQGRRRGTGWATQFASEVHRAVPTIDVGLCCAPKGLNSIAQGKRLFRSVALGWRRKTNAKGPKGRDSPDPSRPDRSMTNPDTHQSRYAGTAKNACSVCHGLPFEELRPVGPSRWCRPIVPGRRSRWSLALGFRVMAPSGRRQNLLLQRRKDAP